MRTWILTLSLWGCTLALLAQAPSLPPRPKAGEGTAAGTTLVVKFRPQTDAKGRRILPNVRNHYVLQRLGVQKMTRPFPGRTAQWKRLGAARPGVKPVDLSNIHRITLSPGGSVAEAIRLLEADPAVEYAEPLYRNYRPLYVPNDPQAQPATGAQYQLARIKAYEAWDEEKGDPNVTIGIVDYGFDVNHEDLKGNIAYNPADPVDGVDNDGDGYLDNYAGWNVATETNAVAGSVHGSFVAGCAAATPDNGKGIAGVGFRCKFLPVAIDDFTGYDGLFYAVDRGCKVINLSWGRRDGESSRYEQDLINYAVINHDVVVVAAAGNDNNTAYYWPASYDNVISVGATDANDAKGGLSNYNDRVDITAPGINLYSTNNGGYQTNSGTSFSAPLVAGAAALLRSRFPDLTAAEVADRLIATADPIDQLAANVNFAGLLGKGRLNVHRALTDPKGVRLTGAGIGGGQNLADGTRERKITVGVKSAFGSFDNLQVILASNTRGVTVASGAVTLGALPAGGRAGNDKQPFAITIGAEVAAGAALVFTLTYRDGAFAATETFTLKANQDYLNVDVNQLHLTATSRGRIGFNDNFNNQGIGVRYKNQPLLFEAGLLLATSPTRVSNCVRDVSPVRDYSFQFTKDDHFRAARPIWYDQSNGADFSASVSFTDEGNPAAMGLRVRQQVYAWKDSPYDKAVVFEYQITNASGADMPQLYAGLFADWDLHGLIVNKVIGDEAYGDQAAWDAARKLGYVFNPVAGIPHAGIQLLTIQTPGYYAFDDVSGINTYNGFTPAEKYLSLTAAGPNAKWQTHPAGGDAAHALGAPLGGLANGETRTIAFALVAGDNLADLRAQADAIRQQFVRVKTSPPPTLVRTEFCLNQAASLATANGRPFRLYARPGDPAPVGTASRFELGILRKDTTVYVAGLDSLFEGARTAVTVKATSSKAIFTASRDSVGLHERHLVDFTDRTPDAVAWDWDFGNGSRSRESSVTHKYTVPGEYTVRLTSTSATGCPSTATRTIRVFSRLTSPLPTVSPLVVCPGAPVRITPGNGSGFNLYASLPLTQPVATGTAFDVGVATRDTVFYVTGTGFPRESEPVAVRVTLSRPATAFTANRDSLGLFEKQVLTLADATPGAVSWQWDLGDGTTAAGAQVNHQYAAPGTYSVQLTTTNGTGCRSTASRTVWVVPGLRSPRPVVEALGLCPGEAIRIAPGNGTRFNLYNALPPAPPIASGADFSLGGATRDTVFYVTGADFMLESEPVAVPVRVFAVRAAFTANADRLNLLLGEALQLTDASTGATWWRWQFGDGTGSQAQHPAHTYAEPGQYVVSLRAGNERGCTDSTTLRITAFRNVVSDLAAAVKLYPNPNRGIFKLGKDDGFQTDRLVVTVTDVLGKEIMQTVIDQPAGVTRLVIPQKGLYHVRIEANGQTVRKRLLIL
jgi:PKD repeat protein